MTQQLQDKQQVSAQGVMTAIGCCLVLSCIGGGSTIVNITIPSICEGLGITVVEAGLFVLFGTIVAFISGLAGTKFLYFLTPRWSMLAGALSVVVCLIIAGLAPSLPVFVFSGAFSGFACSCTFPPIASLMSLHFKENSGKWFGMTTGVQVFIVAGLIKIAGTLFRSYDYHFVLLAFATGMAIVGFLSCFLLIRQPKRSVMLANMKEAAAKQTDMRGTRERDADEPVAVDGEFGPGLSIKEALRTPSLYLFCIGMAAGAIIVGSMTSFGSTFFVLFGMSQADATDMMSLYTLFCGVHVLWTGFFQAKFGSRVFIIVQYAAILVGIVLLVLWADNQSAIFVVLGLLFLAFIKPINSTPALLLPDLFGRKHYLAFNSLSNGVYYVGICINSQTTSAILTALGGAHALWYMGAMAIVAAVVFIAAIALSPMKKLWEDRQ